MKLFHCQCSNSLFFDNSQCLQCFAEVGYDSISGQMQAIGDGSAFKRCNNGVEHGACNWLIPADSHDLYCVACQTNQVIPDLSNSVNLMLWAKMEVAKKRALYSLFNARLPVLSQHVAGPLGLAFQFLQQTPDQPVTTGHDRGVITINIEEADDVIRERNRLQLGEPYRTLLGHFRHELGHYYWSLWFEQDVRRDRVLPALRELFGDDSADYASAMQHYYQNGPLPDWLSSFVSAYATMHPWEDWAETWAHYLHLTDTLETADAFGIKVSTKKFKSEVPDLEELVLPAPFDQANAAEFANLLQKWVSISPAINEISRSLGQPALYPFVLSVPVARKLHLIHRLMEWGSQVSPTSTPVNPA